MQRVDPRAHFVLRLVIPGTRDGNRGAQSFRPVRPPGTCSGPCSSMFTPQAGHVSQGRWAHARICRRCSRLPFVPLPKKILSRCLTVDRAGINIIELSGSYDPTLGMGEIRVLTACPCLVADFGGLGMTHLMSDPGRHQPCSLAVVGPPSLTTTGRELPFQ